MKEGTCSMTPRRLKKSLILPRLLPHLNRLLLL